MGKDGKYWIEKLGLERHPEGGYFRQTYRADIEIAQQALPARFQERGGRVLPFIFCLRPEASRLCIGCGRMRSGIFMLDRH